MSSPLEELHSIIQMLTTLANSLSVQGMNATDHTQPLLAHLHGDVAAASISPSPIPYSQRIIPCCASCIKVLHLKIAEDEMVGLDGILGSLIGPAPHLYSFRFELPRGFSEVQLPKDIFNRDVPSLRRLELQRCSVDWSLPIFSPWLTHLTLKNDGIEMDIDQFFLAIGRMPELRQLHCYNESVTVTRMQSSTRVKLDHLEKLTLHDSHSVIMMFLSRLELPSTTFVKLSLDPFEVEHEDALHSFIRERYDTNPRMPLQSLTCGYNYLSSPGLLCSSVIETHQKNPHPMGNPGPVEILFTGMWKFNHCNIIRFCASLPLSCLHKLTLSSDDFKVYSDTRIGSDARRLKQIGYDCYPTSFIHALDPSYATTSSSTILAPDLVEIELRALEFTTYCRDTVNIQYTSPMCLISMLTARANQQHKLQRLKIDACRGFEESHISKLRDVVDEVDVSEATIILPS